MKSLIRKWAARRRATIPAPTKDVAVMVPMPSAILSATEEVSMRHLRSHLGRYDKYLLMPKGQSVRIDGFEVMEVSGRYFGSAANHNRMLYRTEFWELFVGYEYVLMYHLDALVFSDQLSEWCGKGYDYIGAPFMVCSDSPWVKRERVGNGGFALYRIPAVLKVLWSRYAMEPGKYLEDHCWPVIDWQRRKLRPLRAAAPGWMRGRWSAPLQTRMRKLDHVEVNDVGNDTFWADEARRYDPDFRVAPVEDGLRFAFEVAPRDCWERNGRQLPFGCHAWTRYDRSFWEPHVIREPAEEPPRNMPACQSAGKFCLS